MFFERKEKNIQGFSLIELMISLSISAGVIWGVNTFYKNISYDMKNVDQQSEFVLGLSLANKIISKDLRNSMPSYDYFIDDQNTEYIEPINGRLPFCRSTNLPKHPQFWEVTELPYCYSLIYELDGEDVTTFSFTIQDTSLTEVKENVFEKKEAMIVPILDFYDATTSVSFSKKKFENILKKKALYEPGSQVKIKSLSQKNGKDNAITVQVDGQGIASTVDEFLRSLRVEGGMAKVFVIPVKTIDYVMEKPTKETENGYHLYRYENDQRKLIAIGIKGLEFVRETSSDYLLSFELISVRRLTKDQ